MKRQEAAKKLKTAKQTVEDFSNAQLSIIQKRLQEIPPTAIVVATT
jgi:hypothetical protein